MTKIKCCGLSRFCDIEAANRLMPEYIGFVFAPKSRRYVSVEKARLLKQALSPAIKAVGVFVNETPQQIAALIDEGVIDIVQLHGNEDEAYIEKLRTFTDAPIIRAFCIETAADVEKAAQSTADAILLDSGAGSGKVFNWKLLTEIKRPYFLAGGLSANNITKALQHLTPYAVDVSSGIETDGDKDQEKMAAFIAAVRKEEQR